MLSVFVVVPLTICLLAMIVPACAFSTTMLGMIVLSLPEAIQRSGWASGVLGWMLSLVTMGTVMAMVSVGSFRLGSYVINGFINRFF